MLHLIRYLRAQLLQRRQRAAIRNHFAADRVAQKTPADLFRILSSAPTYGVRK